MLATGFHGNAPSKPALCWVLPRRGRVRCRGGPLASQCSDGMANAKAGKKGPDPNTEEGRDVKVKCETCPKIIERLKTRHPRRCRSCRAVKHNQAQQRLCHERKQNRICIWCRGALSPNSKIYCEKHLQRHAARQAPAMRAKRAADPAYREKERNAVRERMRKRRAALRSGLAGSARLPTILPSGALP